MKRVLDRRPTVLLARRGEGADHPSAALNIAALIATVADRPGRRALNAADPDCPDGRSIASIVAAHLGYTCQEILLDDTAPEGLGRHPWDRVPPIVLDTAGAGQLGYTPVGDYRATAADEIDWLFDTATRSAPHDLLAGITSRYGTAPSDYADEEDYLRRRAT